MRTNSFSVSQIVENKQIQNLCKLCTNKLFRIRIRIYTDPQCVHAFKFFFKNNYRDFYVKCKISKKKKNKGKFFDLIGIRIQSLDFTNMIKF